MGPTPTPLFALNVGFQSTRTVPILSGAFELRTDLPLVGTVESGARVHALVLTGSLLACVHVFRGGIFYGCPMLTAGLFSTGARHAATDWSGVYAAAGARFGVAIPFASQKFAVTLAGDVLGTILPVRLILNEQLVWQTGSHPRSRRSDRPVPEVPRIRACRHELRAGAEMRRLIICQFGAEEAARIDLLWSRVLKELRKDTAAIPRSALLRALTHKGLTLTAAPERSVKPDAVLRDRTAVRFEYLMSGKDYERLSERQDRWPTAAPPLACFLRPILRVALSVAELQADFANEVLLARLPRHKERMP